MRFNRNSFDKLTPPTLTLCKGNHDKVCVIHPLTYQYTVNFSDLNQVTFSVAYKVDNEVTPYYDMIDIMHFVEIDGHDFFLITSVNVQNEGTENETKEVTATSAECTLGQKYISEFTINYGTTGSIDGVRLYNLADKSHSLLHLALELAPEWTIGHVDASLQTMQRSFEVDRQDIYSFLMEDVANAFECFFVFDTIHQRISVYSENNVSLDTNIYVSYNNLLKNGELSCSTDDVKTCLQLTSSDETYGSIREINAGSDKIYNFNTFNTTDYWSQDLYDAYNAWVTLYESKIEEYNNLLLQYQTLYKQINDWQTNKIPSTATRRNVGYGSFSIFNESLEEIGTVTWDKYNSISVVNSLPSSTDSTVLWIVGTDMYRYSSTTGMFNVNNWTGYSLDNLNVELTAAQNQQSTAMKAGYGEESSQYYTSQYYIYYATVQNIKAKISDVELTISQFKEEQSEIGEEMASIAEEIAMENNFTEAELKELSQFIREDQLSGDNYAITSIMDDDERFETLQAFLDYGKEELAKVAMPKLSFSSDIINLFEIPEFDAYSGEFSPGNYIWVTFRDNFNVKAKLLSINVDFYDATQFTCEFGNVYRRAENAFTAIQDAINTASSAATSVSMNRSYWTEAAKDTDDIGKMLQDGLLSAGTVLTDGTASEMVIDTRGIFVNTSDESEYPNDSIFIGGGRILFTDDDWETVSEAIGRVTIKGESVFGVLAQAVIAGYIAGSTIEGNTISGNEITGNSISNANGTFKADENGNLIAAKGYIACDFQKDSSGHYVTDEDGNYIPKNGFVIATNKIYNSKSSLTSNTAGVYIGTDGISLGSGSVFKVTSDGKLYATSAEITGKITASEGTIGGFTITSSAIYNGKTSLSSTNSGVYIGTDGIALGANTTFQVTKAGILTATSGKIGGFTITASSLYNTKSSLTGNTEGVYVGSDGISLGTGSTFKVTKAGALTATSATITGTITSSSGTIGGCKITTTGITSSNGSSWYINADGSAKFSNVTISGYATDSALNAVSARVGTIEANYITASTVAANYATITSLNSVSARVGTIESDYITTGELNAHEINADKVTAGVLSVDRIPNLNANKITSGTIDAARISTTLSNGVNGVTMSANKVTADAFIFNGGSAMTEAWRASRASTGTYDVKNASGTKIGSVTI